MRTRKGIYKTRSKRGKRLNTRKGLKHRRKRTFKKLKGGRWFPSFWGKKVKEDPSASKILLNGLEDSAKTTARTVSKAMGLVTETAERSVELTGASLNLGLNITHGTVDTTNLAFLAVNKVLQSCLNLIIKGFDETYSKISQCTDHKYADNACVASCIMPIMNNFKTEFDKRREKEYTNLTDHIKATNELINKAITYFCTRGVIYGRSCSKDLRAKIFEAKFVADRLNRLAKDIKVEEDQYAASTIERINSGTYKTCEAVKPLCIEYIERLCTPLQKSNKIKSKMKEQEDLLLSWNEKIEDFKQESDLKGFLEEFKRDQTEYNKEKEKRINQQKQKQEERVKKIVGLLTKSSEIDICEREIILFKELIEKKNHFQSSITATKKNILLLNGALALIQQKIKSIGDVIKKSEAEAELLQRQNDLSIAQEELRQLEEELNTTKTKIEEFIKKQKEILGNSVNEYNVVDMLREKIKEIEFKQSEEAKAEAVAAVAAAAATEVGDAAVAAANSTVKTASNAQANAAAKAAANAQAKAATNAQANAATNAATKAAAKAAANAAAKASANADPLLKRNSQASRNNANSKTTGTNNPLLKA
jgi:hypothetical protein